MVWTLIGVRGGDPMRDGEVWLGGSIVDKTIGGVVYMDEIL